MILAGGFLLGSLAFGNGIEYAIGALLGIMLTPDLDVDGGYIGGKIIRNKVGRWAERAWDVLWYFYRKSLKHGSELSHFPIISTLFRLAYLGFFLVGIPSILIYFVSPHLLEHAPDFSRWVDLVAHRYRLILGLMGSDLIHYTLDTLTTEHSKKKRRIEVFGMPLASSMCK
jgi:uncharacterized metal-binding protein